MDPNKEIDAAIEANICTSQKSLEQGEIDAVAIDIDPKASAKVCWKFDTRSADNTPTVHCTYI